MPKSQRTWDKDDVITFGNKHRGDTVMHVILHDVSYITWCIKNLEWFVLNNSTYQTYERFAETPHLNSHLRT